MGTHEKPNFFVKIEVSFLLDVTGKRWEKVIIKEM